MADDGKVRVDVCGVCCPLPLIELAKAVKTLRPGQTFEIVGNDPIFESSVRDYCHANGHDVLDARPEDGRRVAMTIRVGGRS